MVEAHIETPGLLSHCGSRTPEHMSSIIVASRLSGPTRDGSLIPCIGRQILNHGTTREVPILFLSNSLTFLFFFLKNNQFWGFPDGLVVKNLPANVGNTGSVPDLGRSHIGTAKPMHHNY